MTDIDNKVKIIVIFALYELPFLYTLALEMASIEQDKWQVLDRKLHEHNEPTDSKLLENIKEQIPS